MVVASSVALGGGWDAPCQGFARFLWDRALAPIDDWSAYAPPRAEAANFGLRFQIAFHGYAIAMLGERLPAYRAPTVAALRAIIDRFLHPRVWAYWLARGADLDPVGPHNVMYSGHLGQLLGWYARFTDDGRYDRPFELDDGAASRHTHTHLSVIETLARQMDSNRSHGVTCEPGTIYVACNDHSALALALYDAVHGTHYGARVSAWVDWTRRTMVRRRGGVFAVAYLEPYNFVVPVSVQVMDVWSLAFLSPIAPDLFATQYRRWRRLARRAGDEAYAAARWPNALLEIADAPFNTGFAAIAAREAGDHRLADAFGRYAERVLGLRDGLDGRACYDTRRRTMITALFAIAAAIDRPGRMRQIVAPRPPGFFARPALVACDGASVTAADWDAVGALTLGVVPTGRGPVTLTATAVGSALSVDRGQVAQVGPAADGAQRAVLALDGPARVWWPKEHNP